jgi:hypothetical protein
MCLQGREQHQEQYQGNRTMKANTKVTIWLKDGAIFKDWVFLSADIKINGLPFNSSALDKIDNAFLYSTDGSKFEKDDVLGTIRVSSQSFPANVDLQFDKIDELLASAD